MSQRVRTHTRSEDSTYDLNLAPMLDMLVVLITVLLVSFTTIRLGVLDALIPQPVLNALEKDRNKKERDLQIAVKMSPTNGFVVDVTENGKKAKTINIPNIDGKMNLTKFHKELVTLKLLKTDNFRIEFNPSEEASYDDLIQVMDRMRTTTQGDEKVFIKDEKTGQLVETNLLFPDIIFSNAMEG